MMIFKMLCLSLLFVFAPSSIIAASIATRGGNFASTPWVGPWNFQVGALDFDRLATWKNYHETFRHAVVASDVGQAMIENGRGDQRQRPVPCHLPGEENSHLS